MSHCRTPILTLSAEGLWVPANPLFEAAFPGLWSDAYSDCGRALLEVYAVIAETLDSGGDIWKPEAGQSDLILSGCAVEALISERPILTIPPPLNALLVRGGTLYPWKF